MLYAMSSIRTFTIQLSVLPSTQMPPRENGTYPTDEDVCELFAVWLEHKLNAADKGWLGKYLAEPTRLLNG